MADAEPEDDFEEEDEEDKKSDRPYSWIEGTFAVKVGRWLWDNKVLDDIQRWGDRHCCRFIVVSETNNEKDYTAFLYAAPKPNGRSSGLCDLAIENRDRHLPMFRPWLEGYLGARGLIPMGSHLTDGPVFWPLP